MRQLLARAAVWKSSTSFHEPALNATMLPLPTVSMALRIYSITIKHLHDILQWPLSFDEGSVFTSSFGTLKRSEICSSDTPLVSTTSV